MSTDKEIAAVISEELSVPSEPDIKSQFSAALMAFFGLLGEFCSQKCKYFDSNSKVTPKCNCTVQAGCFFGPFQSVGLNPESQKFLVNRTLGFAKK